MASLSGMPARCKPRSSTELPEGMCGVLPSKQHGRSCCRMGQGLFWGQERGCMSRLRANAYETSPTWSFRDREDGEVERSHALAGPLQHISNSISVLVALVKYYLEMVYDVRLRFWGSILLSSHYHSSLSVSSKPFESMETSRVSVPPTPNALPKQKTKTALKSLNSMQS